MAELSQISQNKTFDGTLTKYKFTSKSLGGLEAQFNVFLPKESKSAKVPVLYYLAGLTCNEDTGPWKGGFIRDAAAEGIALVFPDTSPRGAGIEGEDADWDFGTGAGFYLDATSEAYSKHYNMFDPPIFLLHPRNLTDSLCRYSYITSELPSVLSASSLPLDLSRSSIFGHSMGGHGALTIYLRSLEGKSPYLSASAFAPIANPTLAPWGEKAFKGYLKGGLEEGKEWDATELLKKVKKGTDVKILVDVGLGDNFYNQKQLLPENFQQVVSTSGFTTSVNLHEGYDHSYYFISTFAPAHVKFHAQYLKA
ncbi:S-formylglutathione hydrolase, partial [Phenoliferia sp. Uapishka_3]